jgi:hypothetical protein
MIGMSSQLDVLLDNPTSVRHRFNLRIPVRQVSLDGLKLFASRDPKGRMAIVLQSAVSVSAIYPRQPQRTDFILTIASVRRISDFHLKPIYQPPLKQKRSFHDQKSGERSYFWERSMTEAPSGGRFMQNAVSRSPPAFLAAPQHHRADKGSMDRFRERKSNRRN